MLGVCARGSRSWPWSASWQFCSLPEHHLLLYSLTDFIFPPPFPPSLPPSLSYPPPTALGQDSSSISLPTFLVAGGSLVFGLLLCVFIVLR